MEGLGGGGLMITVKIQGDGEVSLVDAKPEGAEVGELLPGLRHYERTGVSPSLIRVAALPESTPLDQRADWLEFMRRPSARDVPATLTDDAGGQTWLFVGAYQRAPDGEHHTWLVVRWIQLGALAWWKAATGRPDAVRLLGRGERGKLLPVADGAPAAGPAPAAPEPDAEVAPVEADDDDAGADAADDAAQPDDEDEAAARIRWDPLTEDFKSACKALKSQILALGRKQLATPQEAHAYFFDGANGRASRLLERWKAVFQRLAESGVGYDPAEQLRLLDHLANSLPGHAAEPPELGIAAAVEYMRGLDRVRETFKRLIQELRISRQNPYVPVDYRGLAEQLASEMRAFREAARRAAVHEGVFGMLVENRVHELVRRWVAPGSLSSGAIAGLKLPNQVDGIVWDHGVMPAVVEHGTVAVVAPDSVAGLFEVKASEDEDLGEFTLRIDELREHMRRLRKTHRPEVPVLGLLIRSPRSYEEVRLLTTNTVTALLHEVPDEAQPNKFRLEINEAGVFDLLRFVYEGVIPVLRSR